MYPSNSLFYTAYIREYETKPNKTFSFFEKGLPLRYSLKKGIDSLVISYFEHKGIQNNALHVFVLPPTIPLIGEANLIKEDGNLPENIKGTRKSIRKRLLALSKEQFLKKNEFILQKRYKDLEENFANDVLEESNKKP